MDEERLTLWRDFTRDVVIILLAVFASVYGITEVSDPYLLGIVLGFAATLLGVPAAVRIDAARRRIEGKRPGNGNSNGGR